VTGERKSIVARRSDVVVCIPSENGAGKARGRGGGKGRGTLPLGSLFEQALLLVLDDVIVRLMGSLGLTEADLRRIHTTFE
jgi:D-arabinose 5-phosphate isomerase GutQ